MAVDRRRIDISYDPRRVSAWIAAFLWAGVVAVLHFGGLEYGIYTQVWWWDLATHSMSGAGVAALFYLYRPEALQTRVGLALVVPAFVLGVGAGFEVYEYLFTDFWYGWSGAFYLRDTVIDLAMDVLGAYAFVVLVKLQAGGFADEPADGEDRT
jgi:hypothetical protein